jgi:hypothetical protein
LSEASEREGDTDSWTDPSAELPAKDDRHRTNALGLIPTPKIFVSNETYLWGVNTGSSQNMLLPFFYPDEVSSQDPRPLLSGREPALVQSNTDAPVAPTDNPLVVRILDERRRAQVEAGSVAQADLAVGDAISLVQRTGLSSDPNVMLSDDGILALQWQSGELGVALLFAGDGVASIAFRRPGQLYADNGVDISVDEDLPESFKIVLSAILS